MKTNLYCRRIVFGIASLCASTLFAQTVPPPSKASPDPDKAQELEALVVEGSLLGQAKALQGTKEATNLVNIISADKMGTFPDLNAAEALRRLPAVSLVLSGGEGRFVSIRGARPQYNGTLVNGFSLPSGDAEIRRNDLVTVSNALIDTIVLTKAALPDTPADGIGGSTNKLMRNPLNLTGREAVANVYYGINENGDNHQDREEFTYGDFIDKQKRFAFQISANRRLTDFFFTEYSVNQPSLTNATGGGQVYMIPGFRYQLTEKEQENKGFDIAFGARLGDNTKLLLRAFKSDSYQDQFVHRYTFNGIAPVLSGGAPVDLNASGGLVTGRLTRLWRTRTWWLTIGGWQLTGTTRLGDTLNLDYGYQDSKSHERYRNDLFANGTATSTVEPIRLTIYEEAIRLFPTGATSQGVLLNPATQRIATVSTAVLRNDWESEKTPYVNLTKDLTLRNGDRLSLKTGMYFRYKEKSNPQDSVTYTALAASTLSFASLGTIGNWDNFDDKGINMGSIPDPGVGSNIVKNNPASFNSGVVGIFPGDVTTFRAKEDIYAGYAMGTYTHDRLTLIAGARFERTDEEFKRLTTNTSGVYREFSDSYDNFLPAVHLKYTLAKDMFLRASWANTVGRPDAINIYGTETRDDVGLTINQPNPGLKALESTNLDISFDWYTGKLGQFMVGAFSKDIDNFPFSTIDRIVINGNTYTRTSFQANAKGKIRGLEVSLRRNLDFLPGLLSGLGADVNYAKLDSEVNHPIRIDRPRLPDQPEYVFNASIYYAYRRAFARIALSEEGQLLRGTAATPIFDEVREVYRTFDFTANYEFGRERTYQVYVEWRNMTNAPDQSRYNVPGILVTRTHSGSNIGGGLRVRF